MKTTPAVLKAWFDEGVEKGATHMIVMCDTFDYEDYPKYVYPGEEFWDVFDKCRGEAMQRAMEVYSISMGWEAQAEGRAYNTPPTPPGYKPPE